MSERELLVQALMTIERMSGLLNDLSARLFEMAGDSEPDQKMSGLLRRRFQDCSGVGLFIEADRMGVAYQRLPT